MKILGPRNSYSIIYWYKVLDAIKDGGQYTRPQIVQKTNINSYTVSNIMWCLIRNELVEKEIKEGTYEQKGRIRRNKNLLYLTINKKGLEFLEKEENLVNLVKSNESS